VDPGEKQEYQWALKLGVAEAAGLAHPGQKGTTYLFAHSVGTRADFARYNAIFYLLHKLETGDGVEVVYQGKLYKYEVVAKEILAAGDLKYLQPQTTRIFKSCDIRFEIINNVCSAPKPMSRPRYSAHIFIMFCTSAPRCN